MTAGTERFALGEDGHLWISVPSASAHIVLFSSRHFRIQETGFRIQEAGVQVQGAGFMR